MKLTDCYHVSRRALEKAEIRQDGSQNKGFHILDAYLSDVYRQLQKSVSRGSVKAIELALKRSGKLIDKREVSSDISIEVTAIDSKSNAQLENEIKELERKLKLSLPPGDIIDVEVGEDG